MTGKQLLIRLLKPIVSRRRLEASAIEGASIRSILVIRQHDMLGDFLLSTPVFAALRDRFPGARIGVLVRDYFAEVAINHPDIDEVIMYRKKQQWRIRNLIALFRQLYRRWDLVIVLNTVSHSLSSDFLANLASTKYILGSEYPPLDGGVQNFFYDFLAPYDIAHKHQTHRNLDIVRALGAVPREDSESMVILESERSLARSRLLGNGLDPGVPALGIHLGAGKLANRWPVERFAELADRLYRNGKGNIVLFWGPGEAQLVEAYRAIATSPAIEAPPTGLRPLAAAFTQCRLLVCNDTGIMHVCAAVGVPLVAIFGPTDPKFWKPIGNRFFSVRADDGRIESVTVDDVYATVCAALNDKANASRAQGRTA